MLVFSNYMAISGGPMGRFCWTDWFGRTVRSVSDNQWLLVGSGKELPNSEQFEGPMFLTFWHIVKHTFEKKILFTAFDQISIMNFEDTFLQTCITFEMFRQC